jgi:hypothetical protein
MPGSTSSSRKSPARKRKANDNDPTLGCGSGAVQIQPFLRSFATQASGIPFTGESWRGCAYADHFEGSGDIPIEIREQAGLLLYTQVKFEFDGKAVKITRAKGSEIEGRGGKLVKHLRGRGDVMMTTDEIMALTRGK